MIGCEEDDKPPPTLEGLINRYNRWVSTKRLHTKTLGSFAAQEATQATLAVAEPKPRSTHRKQCVCGLPHDIWRCYTLNETAEGRPEGYKLSSKAVRNCQNAFKNADRLKGVKKLFKEKNIPWTFEVTTSTEAENRPARPTRPYSPGQGRRPNADRIDDAESNGEYYANTAFRMSQITTLRGDSLLDR